MKPLRKSLPLALGLGVLLALATMDAALAEAGNLPGGSTVCTDQTRSDKGVALYGTVTPINANVTWTVLAASSPGGTETQIFRTTGYNLSVTHVPAPAAGTFYYRTCLANTTKTAVTDTGVATAAEVGATNALAGIGPTRATLGPGGLVCAESVPVSGRLVASSTVAVQWRVRAFNGDGAILRQQQPLTVTSTSVDRVVGPGPYASLDVCTTNTSSSTATLSFEFQKT